jgi:hypothetical protein
VIFPTFRKIGNKDQEKVQPTAKIDHQTELKKKKGTSRNKKATLNIINGFKSEKIRDNI